VVLALAIFVLLTRGPEPPKPNPPGTFSFAVLGDAPYFEWEDIQFPLVLKALDQNDLSFIIDVGDIFWEPCSDAMYQKTFNRLSNLRHPVIYTPGDNEWTDCWQPGAGEYAPLERLAKIREIFFSNPTRSLGQNPLSLETQSTNEPFHEYVENARWVYEGIVFATVDIVGSKNANEKFDKRTEADNEASRLRTEAAAAWVRETFAKAKALNANAVVLSFHANADIEKPDSDYHHWFEPFLTAVEEETEKFPKPVLLAHGDGHIYTVDQPMVRRTTGQLLENLTRLQVPGSPRVGWVRVFVTQGPETKFSFENHVVPRWKYW